MSYLANDVLVSESNYQSVLRCVVLVFILGDQAFTSIVISFSFASPFEFYLKSFKIGSVFDDLYVPLKYKIKIFGNLDENGTIAISVTAISDF